MHSVGFVDTEDMNVVSGKRKHTSLVGYSSSKLAQVRSVFGITDFFKKKNFKREGLSLSL